jgi:GxxExxY protein
MGNPINQYGFELTQKVLGCAFEVHSGLGVGLLESAYEHCLYYELKINGFSIEQQVPMTVRYKDLIIPNAFKADLVVEDTLIIELKTIDKLLPMHDAQIIHYMHLAQMPLGLLLNFKEKSLKNGIKRFCFEQYAKRNSSYSSHSVA